MIQKSSFQLLLLTWHCSLRNWSVKWSTRGHLLQQFIAATCCSFCNVVAHHFCCSKSCLMLSTKHSLMKKIILKRSHLCNMYSTSRFNVVLHLCWSRSQMMSKYEKTKTLFARHSWICHWCSYHILTSSVIHNWKDPRQHRISLFYVIKKENVDSNFICVASIKQ